MQISWENKIINVTSLEDFIMHDRVISVAYLLVLYHSLDKNESISKFSLIRWLKLKRDSHRKA